MLISPQRRAKRELGVGCEVLLALDADDEVIEEHAVNVGKDVVVDPLGEVDTGDHCTERAGLPGNREA